MKVSMDGLRMEQISGSKKLKTFIDEEIIPELNEQQAEELKEKLDAVFCSINMGLCVYDPETKDDFNDLSNLSIPAYQDE